MNRWNISKLLEEEIRARDKTCIYPDRQAGIASNVAGQSPVGSEPGKIVNLSRLLRLLSERIADPSHKSTLSHVFETSQDVRYSNARFFRNLDFLARSIRPIPELPNITHNNSKHLKTGS